MGMNCSKISKARCQTMLTLPIGSHANCWMDYRAAIHKHICSLPISQIPADRAVTSSSCPFGQVVRSLEGGYSFNRLKLVDLCFNFESLKGTCILCDAVHCALQFDFEQLSKLDGTIWTLLSKIDFGDWDTAGNSDKLAYSLNTV